MKYVKLGISALVAQNIYSNCYKSIKAPTVDEVIKILKLDKNAIISTETLDKIDEKKNENIVSKAMEKDFKEHGFECFGRYYITAQRNVHREILLIIYKKKINETNTANLEKVTELNEDEVAEKLGGGIYIEIAKLLTDKKKDYECYITKE